MNASRKQLLDARLKPKEELLEIIRYLTAWSRFGDIQIYANFVSLCGNTTYRSDDTRVAMAYDSTIDLLDNLNDVQIGNVYKKLKQAGLLAEPYTSFKVSFQ